jgi:hypothetical protein
VGIRVWDDLGHVLFPEPVHLGRIDDAGIVVLLVAAVLVFVSREKIWVTGDRNVQNLSDDPRLVLIACQKGEDSRLHVA